MSDPEIARPFEPDAEVAEALKLTKDGKQPRRRWPWVLLGVLLLAAIALAATLRATAPQTAFETVGATRGELVQTVTAVGTVEPRNAVEIASELSGIVRSVEVQVNEAVTADQILARLDTDLLKAQVDQARAQVRAMVAALEQARVATSAAKQDLDRAEQLGRAQMLPQAELDRARSAYQQAVASLGVAEGNLGATRAGAEVAATNLAKADIRTPISGIVLDRHIEPGQAVVSALQAQTLFRVAEGLDHMEVVVDIDEADISRVQEGQTATFTVAAHGTRVFEAEVAEVKLSPTVAQQIVSYEATLYTDNPDGALVPGMTATAEIITAVHEDAVLVPNTAMRFAPSEAEPVDGPHVWVLSGEAPEARPVVLGASDGRNTVVIDGLDAGEAVVVEEIERRRGDPR